MKEDKKTFKHVKPINMINLLQRKQEDGSLPLSACDCDNRCDADVCVIAADSGECSYVCGIYG